MDVPPTASWLDVEMDSFMSGSSSATMETVTMAMRAQILVSQRVAVMVLFGMALSFATMEMLTPPTHVCRAANPLVAVTGTHKLESRPAMMAINPIRMVV